MSNWDEEDRRTNETKRGLDDARDGRNNPPSDPEGRQAYEAGRNVHVEEESRRRYADQVAGGAASFNSGTSTGNSSGGSVLQGLGAWVLLLIVLVFTLLVHTVVRLPFDALDVRQPWWISIPLAVAVFAVSFFAVIYTRLGRKFLLFGVPALILLTAIFVAVRNPSSASIFGVTIISSVAFGLCWIAYRHLENEAPL